MTDQTIFRAYDIRGIVDESLTADTVTLIGKALGTKALAKNQQTIITARDGRLSGPVLMKALQQGILSTGCNVIDIGEAPTPVLYFATHFLDTQSGVVLTGSHNPPNYNGIKMVVGGETLADKDIQALYQMICKENFSEGQGKLEKKDITTDYINRITNDVKSTKPLKVVIDCGNGIAGAIAPKLYKKMGCELIELYCDVDGTFPNHHPDPSEAENLKELIETVKREKADIGLAFDGDGDRLGVVTNAGDVIWPDRQLMLFAIDVLSRNPGALIIYDVKSTRHIQAVVEKNNGEALMWRTGHSFVKRKLKETGALLAGEMSGHTFFKERWYGFDDGLYAGARLLEILSNYAGDAHTLFQTIPNSINTPELKLPVDESEKFQLMETLKTLLHFPDATTTHIDGIRADFPKGWGLIRASNTTPYLVLRFEADDEASLKQIQQTFREQIQAIDAKLQLPF